jgi:hypothetical protein
MPTRVYVIFAPEDQIAYNRLNDQARKSKVDVAFSLMQPKLPWVPLWKGQCRTKIRECNGAVLLISKPTKDSPGLSYEIACAREAEIPILGVHVDKFNKGALPDGLGDSPVIDWNWPEIETFLQSFNKRTWGASTSP